MRPFEHVEVAGRGYGARTLAPTVRPLERRRFFALMRGHNRRCVGNRMSQHFPLSAHKGHLWRVASAVENHPQYLGPKVINGRHDKENQPDALARVPSP
jgi:hypothetical protein